MSTHQISTRPPPLLALRPISPLKSPRLEMAASRSVLAAVLYLIATMALVSNYAAAAGEARPRDDAKGCCPCFPGLDSAARRFLPLCCPCLDSSEPSSPVVVNTRVNVRNEINNFLNITNLFTSVASMLAPSPPPRRAPAPPPLRPPPPSPSPSPSRSPAPSPASHTPSPSPSPSMAPDIPPSPSPAAASASPGLAPVPPPLSSSSGPPPSFHMSMVVGVVAVAYAAFFLY